MTGDLSVPYLFKFRVFHTNNAGLCACVPFLSSCFVFSVDMADEPSTFQPLFVFTKKLFASTNPKVHKDSDFDALYL